MRINNRILASALSVVLLGLAACGDDGESTNESSGTVAPVTTEVATAAPGGAGVTIAGFGFNTGDGVTAGEAFTVTNDDPATHTFTDVGGAFSVSVSGGDVSTLTVDAPGTYSVVCEIHPGMAGTLTVK